MKILKTKQLNIAVAWSFLKSVPPKEYETMGDIERSVEIVKKLSESIPAFVEHRNAGEDFNKKVIKNEIQDIVEGEKTITAGEQIEAWHKEFDKKGELIGANEGNEVVDVEFEDPVFNTFFQFCHNKKWGARMWFSEVPDYLSFLADLNQANAMPKSK